MVELKGEDAAFYACNLIKKFNVEDKIVISGRDLDRLRLAKRLCPSIPICLNITHCPGFDIDMLMECDRKEDLPFPIAMISLKSYLILDDEFIKKCHSLDILALAWNFINYRPEEAVHKMNELIDFGIDGILFDDVSTVSPIRKKN
ncbi:MAG: hypothetical protein ACTSWN_11385 [Promethearchaeota archaeon]